MAASHPRGEDTVYGRRRPAALDMPQDRDAGVVLRELLLDTFGQCRGAARLGVFGHDDDRRVLALAEAVVDEFGQLVDLGVHFGDDSRFGTRGDGAVQRQVTRRMSHHLDEEEALVARCRIAQFVDRLHDRVQRRVVADRRVRTPEVVVDRPGKPYDGHVVLLRENPCACQRAVAADDHQRVDAGCDHVVVSRLTSFGRGEFLAARRFENRAAQLDDIAYALGFELYDLVVYETFVSAHDSLYRKAVIDCAAGYRTYCRIHAGGVASRCENADAFAASHSFSFKHKIPQR